MGGTRGGERAHEKRTPRGPEKRYQGTRALFPPERGGDVSGSRKKFLGTGPKKKVQEKKEIIGHAPAQAGGI